MSITRNNHVFKGHKALLGNRYVTYGEVELPTRYEEYSKSENGFDWGANGSGSEQLAYSILCQLTNEEFSKKNASKFVTDIVGSLNARDWILSAIEVQEWIGENTDKEEESIPEKPIQNSNLTQRKRSKKIKQNVVKDVCKTLQITQKQLAHILEVPEGTISSWAVKNEIPRLGKKAIEFYMLNDKNQKIVDSYKNFLGLLNAS